MIKNCLGTYTHTINGYHLFYHIIWCPSIPLYVHNCRLFSFQYCYNFRVLSKTRIHQTGVYMFKVNNKNTRRRFEIFSKLTIKTPERHWSRSGVFIVNFEYISHLALVFLLLTLTRQMSAEYDHLISFQVWPWKQWLLKVSPK